ncbi:histidine--tRNA ligase [Candidatus Woesearchaeota archaeon]|nr:histidine--tRNA ligase [Candidatus Woesearchaeota archaeon]|tara:strand:- start:8600 stop:9871 length:1272 start_codon:yes stop_codon:yes gene_type:complete
MEMKNARGTRDISGEDAILRKQIVGTLKSVFELYGYNPLETPSLEQYETLVSKYAGGEEILKEVFKLSDQGKRDLALRYDLTVPLARFVATNPTLKMPYKRYAVGNVYRDGPLKMGRYREFTQCDVDVVGNSNMTADAEMVKIALTAFEKLELNVITKVNNRKILDAVLEKAGIKDESFETVILSIDKLEKFGKEAVEKELARKGISDAVTSKLMEYISIQGTNKEKIEQLKKIINEECIGLDEIEEVLKFSGNKNVEFEVSLARGLTYYTGTVFEVFLKNSEIKSSLAAGGRYDRMIGQFAQNREYPAVGISFGLDVIGDSIKLEGEERGAKTVVKALVISIKEDKNALEIVEKLRNENINCDADYTGKVGKAIEYADTYGISYVIFVGKKEAKAGKVKLRDMDSGKEQLLTIEQAIRRILK